MIWVSYDKVLWAISRNQIWRKQLGLLLGSLWCHHLMLYSKYTMHQSLKLSQVLLRRVNDEGLSDNAPNNGTLLVLKWTRSSVRNPLGRYRLTGYFLSCMFQGGGSVDIRSEIGHGRSLQSLQRPSNARRNNEWWTMSLLMRRALAYKRQSINSWQKEFLWT